jgi:hypothetical protein
MLSTISPVVVECLQVSGRSLVQMLSAGTCFAGQEGKRARGQILDVSGLEWTTDTQIAGPSPPVSHRRNRWFDKRRRWVSEWMGALMRPVTRHSLLLPQTPALCLTYFISIRNCSTELNRRRAVMYVLL